VANVFGGCVILGKAKKPINQHEGKNIANYSTLLFARNPQNWG
jgi:hypothetical protein